MVAWGHALLWCGGMQGKTEAGGWQTAAAMPRRRHGVCIVLSRRPCRATEGNTGQLQGPHLRCIGGVHSHIICIGVQALQHHVWQVAWSCSLRCCQEPKLRTGRKSSCFRRRRCAAGSHAVYAVHAMHAVPHQVLDMAHLQGKGGSRRHTPSRDFQTCSSKGGSSAVAAAAVRQQAYQVALGVLAARLTPVEAHPQPGGDHLLTV